MSLFKELKQRNVFRVAAAYLAVDDPPAALGSALKALSLDPLSLPIMNSVAFKYLVRGMYAEAIRMDEEMIAMDPNLAAA